MAFQTLQQYNDDRYAGMFMLRNDRDSQDVIIMYQGIDDVLVAPVHYIKSDTYSGYVHCLGASNGCPACAKNISIQNKEFIPLYIVGEDEILYWDRNVNFHQVLENDVFSKCPNPSEFVFRITRHGAAGDRNTRYSIQVIAKNNVKSYPEILEALQTSMPEDYEKVCKTWTVADYEEHLNASPSTIDVDVETMPEYKITPREVTSELPDLKADEIESTSVDF